MSTRGQMVLTTLICASVTLSHTPSLVHVTHAKELIGLSTIFINIFFLDLWAYVFDLSWDEYKYNCTDVMLPST